MLNSALSNRMDKFGFYQVGAHKFYSKFEAQIFSEKTGSKVQWIFNDVEFNSMDWTVEPNESLNELYRQRAQQLRDQYDYLILWFSGGADSTNVLDSFLLNDIKLDEVASYVNYSASGDKFNFLNAEIYNVAIPRISKAKELQPDLKHTVVDICQSTVDFFSKSKDKFDWTYQLSSFINPNNAGRQHIKLTVPAWREMFDAGKKVCFIHGVDKPRVINLKNKFYFKILDVIDPAVSPGIRMLNRPWEFDELFYWSPDFPKIPIKQGHVLKKFLKHATVETPGITKSGTNLVSTTINGVIHNISLDKFHGLIYPHWYPVPYQSKTPSLIFTPRDEWFYKLPESDPAKYAWKVGLEHRWMSLPDHFKNDPSSINRGVKQFSKVYFLGI
jgi:hypothetical protein